MSFGMHVGGGFSSLSYRGGAAPLQYSERSALQALAWAQAPVGGSFFISAEAGFAVKGGVVAHPGPPTPFEIQHTATYAQINPWLGVKIKQFLTVSAGTEFGYLLNYDSPSILSPEQWEVSGAAQVQYNYNDRFSFGMRGSIGLTPLFSYQFTDEFGNDAGKGGEYLNMLSFFARARIGK